MRSEKSQTDCDARRLACYLEQQLSPQEEAELEAHLDRCPACRSQIGQRAVEADWWTDASRYLRRDAWDEAADDSGAGPPSTGERDKSSSEIVLRQIRQWFDPTEDPRYVGRFGGYEILGVIGHSAMSVVLKGYEPSLNRYVAIKILAPALATSGAARQRFAREAQGAAAVLHENVIAIHCVDESHGLPYLVMPYVNGVSLARRIDDGPLPLPAILRVGRQIAAGLAAAHAQGLVHRDIKPANILLERGVERVTITDFGLARAADDGSVTRTGIIAGTPQYMSPEQSRGESLDARSDLFSLGSVLYAMCTCRPPFRAETDYGVLRRITDEEPRAVREINPEIPDWFESIIRRLHAKSPDERWQTADEVAELLEQCLAHVQQPTVVPLPEALRGLQPARPPACVWRRSVRWLGSTLVASLVIAAIAFSLMNRPGGGRVDPSSPTGAASSPNKRTAPDADSISSSAAWDDGAAEQIIELEGDATELERRVGRLWNDITSTPPPEDEP